MYNEGKNVPVFFTKHGLVAKLYKLEVEKCSFQL